MEKITIGILGYNEEYGITHLLKSLQNQTLLHHSPNLEVIVVSNGSQDDTAAVARQNLAPLKSLGVSCQVVELPTADKCNAWNHLIHTIAQAADCYILLDADVILTHVDSLQALVKALDAHPDCRLCGGKVINGKGEAVPYIDGKCYAIRGEIARTIYIPNGVVADDTYIFSTVVTNWYEIDDALGFKRGYVRQIEHATVRFGHTPRDRNKSYWIACRKRTITAEYTQEHIAYCMRSIFGGGETAKAISLKLFATNPNWFRAYLQQVSVRDFIPRFNPPQLLQYSLKDIAQVMVYCYCYLLSMIGIRNQEFGHLAWKLKSRYW